MSTDIEQRVRSGLADAPVPAGLSLDADAVTRVASRNLRRRRTGQALLGGMASLAVLGTVTWAGGWLPGGVQRVLPASPWSACPVSGSFSGESSVRLAALDHSVIPLTDGGTVVVGLGQGCTGGDFLFMSATPASADALPETVPLQGALGTSTDPREGPLSAWWQGLPLPDGRVVTGLMIPGGAQDLVAVGPDAVHEASSEPVRVPGTDLDAMVFEDYWPDGEDLAEVWRGSDGLVHTSWSAGTTSRVWQGDDAGGELTDTWVGQDRQEQQWVMRDGVVQGPFEVSDEPYAVVFPIDDPVTDPATDDPVTVEVVAVLPAGDGALRLAGGGEPTEPDAAPLETLWLDSSEGDRTLHAALVRLGLDAAGELPALEWVPGGDGATPQPVPLLEP